jgi:hypothetical protein
MSASMARPEYANNDLLQLFVLPKDLSSIPIFYILTRREFPYLDGIS